MSRTLYDLAGQHDLRFSPWCWIAKMALRHKGLDAETVPCRFTEIKDRVGFADYDKVPVLVDGARTVTDSWAIAQYLEQTYPDAPSLFGGAAGFAYAVFARAWTISAVVLPMARAVVPDVYDVIDPADRDYFRTSREQRFGTSLDAMRAGQGSAIEDLRAALGPARQTLGGQPYLGGDAPLFPDYMLFGILMWGRCVSPAPLLAPDDPVHGWRERMLDLHDGFARGAPCREAA